MWSVGRKRGNITWSTHSPKKIPLNFIFWVFVKDMAYREEVQNINKFHDRIVGAAPM
jgi:hypothetical protein